MLEIVSCDDEIASLQQIEKCVASVMPKLATEYEFFHYQDSFSLLERIEKHNQEEQVDIVLLDIDMPGMSGLDVAKIIRDDDKDIILIFITAHEEYVYSSFQYAPFRYVRKEFLKEELPLALRDAVAKLETKKSAGIVLKNNKGEYAIRLADIVCIQMEKRQLCVYMKQGDVYTVWKKLKELKQEIDEKDAFFLQVHSGCVINLRHVKTLVNATVIMEGAQELKIPISRRRQTEVAHVITSYWRDHT